MSLFSNIDVSTLKLGQPANCGADGGPSLGTKVKLMRADGGSVSFQTPLSTLKWNSEPRSLDGGRPKASAEINVEAGTPFAEWLQQVDSHVRSLIAADSKKYMGKTVSEEALTGVMINSLHERNGEFSFRPELRVSDGEITTPVFSLDPDAEGNLSPESLRRGAHVVLRVSLADVFIGQAGRLVKVRAYVNSVSCLPLEEDESLQGGAFIPEDPAVAELLEARKKRKLVSTTA